MDYVLIAVICVACVLGGLVIGFSLRTKAYADVKDMLGKANAEHFQMQKMIDAIAESSRSTQITVGDIRQNVFDQGAAAMKTSAELESKILQSLSQSQHESTRTQNELFASFRTDVNQRLDKISETNAQQLAEMRDTVDTKLQKTLDEKLQNSFNSVVEQLSRVQEGLGMVHALATDVGGLKKVLSNVKTRGMLGEIQLGAILSEILSREQYDENVVTVKGTKNPVEYAVKLPGQVTGEFVYLPIDSKFPMDTYQTLLDAYDEAEGGDKTGVTAAWKQLEIRLKQEAKDIHEKYVHVPETTEFAILFLPTEGLYAEAVRRGMVEVLQRDYRVMIAGPTTMAALLNSLQMGFRTLEIQKSSADVWKVLTNVKSEFGKFEEALVDAQKRLRQTDEAIEKLVGTRTRMMNRQLNKVIDPGATGDIEFLPEVTDESTTPA